MNDIQFDDFSCQIHYNDKLGVLKGYPITRARRRQFNEQLNKIEKHALMSRNSSKNWLGTVSSRLCAFYASYLQQMLPDCQFKSLICQLNLEKTVKRQNALTMYPKPQLISSIWSHSLMQAIHRTLVSCVTLLVFSTVK